MEVNTFSIEIPSSSEEVEIWGLTDFHLGNITFDADNLRRTVKHIEETPYAYWFHLGDACEYIGRTDPRFDARAMPSSPDGTPPDIDDLWRWQTDELVKLESPIADKCIGIHGGNHEHAVVSHHSFDPLRYHVSQLSLAAGRPILNLNYGIASTRIRIDRGGPVACIMFNTAHGSGAGRLPGAKINRLYHAIGEYTDDVFMRGHTHELLTYDTVRIGNNRSGQDRIIKEPKHLMYCGCYFKSYVQGYASYAERKELPPNALGSAYVVIKVHIKYRGRHISHTIEAKTTPSYYD